MISCSLPGSRNSVISIENGVYPPSWQPAYDPSTHTRDASSTAPNMRNIRSPPCAGGISTVRRYQQERKNPSAATPLSNVSGAKGTMIDRSQETSPGSDQLPSGSRAKSQRPSSDSQRAR